MSKKKVLYIGGFELPDKNAAAHRVISNAKLLREIGYDTVLIGVDKSQISKGLSKKYTFEGFDYYNVKYPQNIREWIKYAVGIRNILKLIKGTRVSHIIAYNYPAIALYRLLIHSKKYNVKIIGDCTEWFIPKGNALYRFVKSIDVMLRIKVIHPKLDGLIVISEYLRKYYKHMTNNILVLPPLVDLSMNKWKSKFKIFENDHLTLVYAGNPGPGYKDRLDIIIEVLSEIRKINKISFVFKIIGITRLQYEELFGISRVTDEMDKFVSFKGRLTHADTIDEVINSDYYIFLRDNTRKNQVGFPTKYVESISCGTPVLTNSLSNIEHFLERGKMGFVLDYSSKEKLKSTLLKALNVNRTEIRVMKDYCKRSAIFSYKHYINECDHFMKLLDANNWE